MEKCGVYGGGSEGELCGDLGALLQLLVVSSPRDSTDVIVRLECDDKVC